jgi:DMSO/TMAO reductase YedYZ molybdopterin-dependent catalytic subunit
MKNHDISRRALLKGGGALAGLTVTQVTGPTKLFGEAGEQVLPWLDQPPPSPFPNNADKALKWEEITRFTPANNFFFVAHYGVPVGLDPATWRVALGGLVAHPRSLTMDDLKERGLHEVEFTLECSGNNGEGLDFLIGGIGNARWGGARLAPLLQRAGILDEGSEVVFWGFDRGTMTIRDNTGIFSGGKTGTVQPGPDGPLDLTITEQFARSMSVREALQSDNLLCYQMNGEPLPPANGFPVRLIAPGWYGVANVKWLTRIEVMNQRYASNFMARDYVTIREQQREGNTVWTFNTVRHDRLKSAPAKVTRRQNRYTIMGAAWGAPIEAVQVRIDAGPWMATNLDAKHGVDRGFAWRFWTFDWGTPPSGERRVTSRAIDVEGNIQPAPSNSLIANRRTFWENNGHITRRVLIP